MNQRTRDRIVELRRQGYQPRQIQEFLRNENKFVCRQDVYTTIEQARKKGQLARPCGGLDPICLYSRSARP